MSAIFIDGKNSETADRIMACVSIEVSFFLLVCCALWFMFVHKMPLWVMD